MSNARFGWAIRILPAAATLLFVILSIWRLAPPGQDRGGFSTDKAIADLRVIAAEAHPVGVPAHREVRDFLVTRFRQLGYDVQLQDSHPPLPVSNVIARQAGTVQPNKAVMLAAHYDSVRWGPGAADDGAAAAALLEVARVLSSQPHRNDIIFIITDAEELGLDGSRMFVADHPWLKDVGVVLNFEARGTSGPSIMFETSQGNGWLIDLYARHAPHPVCSSISYDVYKQMPNDTDFTIFRDEGHLQGLNFAFIGSYANYHTANDDLAHLDPRSLRHHGIQALELAEAMAEIDLTKPPETGNVVFFSVLSLAVIRYPTAWAPALAVVVSILALGAVGVGLWRKLISPLRLLTATALLVGQLVVVVGICLPLRRLDFDAYESLAIAGYVAWAALITASSFLWPMRRPMDLAAFGLILWTPLTLASGFYLHAGSYLTVLPLLFATIVFATFAFFTSDLIRAIVAAVAGAGIVILLAPVVYLAFLGLRLDLAHVLVVPVVLAVWLLPLQLWHPARPTAMVQ